MTKFSIKKVEIQNFRSIKDKVELNVKPGLYTIEGINCDEPNSKNGAGKSSIISAIYWCLTGTTLTNEVLADEVINEISGKDCLVTLYIESNENQIELTRTRKHAEFGNNLILKIDGQDVSCHKIADTQERLNQLIKIPFNLLHSTIMMTHDIQSAFSDLSPQQRVQTLESIRDYSIWDKVREEANKDIKECDKEINEKTQVINEMTGSYKTYEGLIKTADEEIKTAMETGISLNGKEQLQKYEDELKNCAEELNKKKLELEEAQKTQLEDLSKYTVQLNQINEEYNKKKTNLDNAYKEKLDDLRSTSQKKIDETKTEINNLNSKNQTLSFEVRDLTRQANELQKWFDSPNCPTCGRPLVRTEEEISSKKAKLEKLKTSNEKTSETIKENEKTISEKQVLITSLTEQFKIDEAKIQEEYQNELTKLNEENQKVSRTINEEYKQKQEGQKESKQKVYTLGQEVSKLESKIGEIKGLKIKLEEQLESLRAKIQKLREDKAKYEEETKKITEDGKTLRAYINDLVSKRELSDYYYKLLGSKGELRPYLLNRDIENLNTYMQRYIHSFFKNTEVALRLNGASIEIDINSLGIQKSVSKLSGGEKKRLDLAIQFALYDLLQSTSQISFNILCLDEIEAQLDSLGCQQLIGIIEDLSERVETAYWITNNDMVSEVVPHKIICKKSLGCTQIEEI